MSDPLDTYKQLLAKVDAKFGEIQARHAAVMRCGAGCHQCCQPGLTVSPIEAAALKAYLAQNPAVAATAQALAAERPHGDRRCALLDARGHCSVYAARPIICRSHGVPVAVSDSAGKPPRRDVCPLNFAGTDLTTLPPVDQINLDTLNTLLALLNQQFAGDLQERTKLTITSLQSAPF